LRDILFHSPIGAGRNVSDSIVLGDFPGYMIAMIAAKLALLALHRVQSRGGT